MLCPGTDLFQWARLWILDASSSKGWRQSTNAKWFTDYDADAPTESQELQKAYQLITSELQNASKRRRVLEDEVKALAEK